MKHQYVKLLDAAIDLGLRSLRKGKPVEMEGYTLVRQEDMEALMDAARECVLDLASRWEKAGVTP